VIDIDQKTILDFRSKLNIKLDYYKINRLNYIISIDFHYSCNN